MFQEAASRTLTDYSGMVSFSADGRKLVILADVVDPVVNRAKPKLAIIDLQSATAAELLDPDCVLLQDRFDGGGRPSHSHGKFVVYVIKSPRRGQPLGPTARWLNGRRDHQRQF